MTARRYPRRRVVRCERAHRRWVVVGLAVLLVLATSPLLGHHLPFGIDNHLAGRDHIWALCLIALHVLLAPVHGLFHLLFFGGTVYASWDRGRAWRAQRRALAMLAVDRPARGEAFWSAAVTVGLDPERVRIVAGLPSPAFTTGWIEPNVYVARELASELTEDELVAVLAHEHAHLMRYDPLRLSLLRFLSCMLFWLPAVRRLADDVADDTEIQADDHAAIAWPLPLASAIVKLAHGWPRSDRAAHDSAMKARFDGQDLLARRVLRLAGEDVRPASRLTGRTACAAALALSLAIGSGFIVAHPLPPHEEHAASHCEHHDDAPLRHLFCLGFAATLRDDDCPHRTV